MKLSARSRYAARLLLELAQHAGAAPIKASFLAERTGISVQFIEQIIKPLKKGGLVHSLRGASGGHSLAVEPQDVTLARIVEIMEDGISLTKCCADPNSCGRVDDCKTRSAWMHASKALREGLEAISLADLMDSPASSASLLADDPEEGEA
ncbi:RrF2 family transcriptional regulator [Desulfobaculum sp. SPO524]|uniref:RrF2 family transcriptional regulator n=1 Tax=Desulfobaculum sp. SPO524 TaxID=3378071 RepID=UPI0038552794